MTQRSHAGLLVALLVAAAPGLATAALGEPASDHGVPCQGQVPAPEGCPNLVADERSLWDAGVHETTWAEDDCAVVEGLVEPGQRRLLRFSFTTFNQGPGDLVLGDPAEAGDLFTWSPCPDHEHHHFDGFAAYRLWTVEGYAGWTAARTLAPGQPAEEVLAANPALAEHLVSGQKQGFCIEDVRPVAPLAGSPTYHCHHQGISVGWADVYGWHLDGQWVDVTGLEEGYYVLEAEVNPQRILQEASYQDNRASTHVYVPGDW